MKKSSKPLPPKGAKPSNPSESVRPVFPIVGIGASAGGLAAFEAFFSGLPDDKEPGMAFVLVQHLAPDHDSLLTELIRRSTRLPVFEVEDGIRVEPNSVYIIPPGRDMAFLEGSLHLLEPAKPHGHRLPIDFFFQSLARDQRERAIGIILSGTGSDGTQGIRAIKSEGGMVMAQSVASSEFDGMPRSAVATGQVDYELAPAEMPARLIAYAAHSLRKAARPETEPVPRLESALKKIFILLRAQTGHDFSHYKPSTVHRRIERRMAVHQIETLANYVQCLQQIPTEVEALFRDLLIGVTNFFRDPEAFQVLEEEIIPRFFEGKPAGSVIRVWSTGCSTGEEAYSLAILLQERIDQLKSSYVVQVFATDIDSRAIATARAGVYPASISADISPERLTRFFSPEASGTSFRVKKSLRDLLIFSEQDVIKDPPFSRLDLISCRNLLIYLDGELQKKLIPLFHYALKPGGTLFLGTSEGIGEFGDIFTTLDRKAKIYGRKEHFHSLLNTAVNRILIHEAPGPTRKSARAPETKSPRSANRQSLREITEQALIQQVISAAVLVSESGDILFLHGRTGMFLEPAPGEAGINNILKMAREGLRRDLTAGLRQAVSTRATVHVPRLRVKTNGHFTTVHLTIRPVTTGPAATPESPLYLVILEEAGALDPEPAPIPPKTSEKGAAKNAAPAAEARIAALLLELSAKDELIQSTLEELESSNEELKSSNEEMQSVNEEMQSTNEELETSKEEMQSMNEELATVNSELQVKVSDLSRANNDMNNLLSGTGIGTVFVDHQLRILRFTPAVGKIINLIPGDIGRPVAHIVSNLVGTTNLVAEVQTVLNTLVPMEAEVVTHEGAAFMMRIQPYRTQDNVIEGAVISFVDVSERVRTREALRKANELLRLAVVVRDAHDAITVQDLEGRTLAWNPGAVRMYGWSEAEALQMHVRDRIPADFRREALATLRQLSQSATLQPHLTERLTKMGAILKVSITSTALINEAGDVYAIATTERAMPGDA